MGNHCEEAKAGQALGRLVGLGPPCPGRCLDRDSTGSSLPVSPPSLRHLNIPCIGRRLYIVGLLGDNSLGVGKAGGDRRCHHDQPCPDHDWNLDTGIAVHHDLPQSPT